jgi:hypothetical protein
MSEASVSSVESTTGGRSFVERLLGVLRLDGAAYDEIGADANAAGQAAAVVVLAAVCRAIAAEGGPLATQGLLFLVQIPLLWLGVSALAFGMGRFFGFDAPFARVLRVMGFAFAPFALTVAGVVPVEPVRIAVAFLSTALLLATFVVGVRHALRTTLGWAGFVSLLIAMILAFVSMSYLYVTT